MKHKMTGLVAAALVIAVLAAVGVYGWRVRAPQWAAEMQNRLAGEISRVLNVPVTVGRMELLAVNKLAVHDVVISDNNSRPLAVSERVIVQFSLASMILNQSGVGAINEINIEQPQFFVSQAADGRWNVADLWPKQTRTEAAFTGLITAAGGRLTVSTPQGQWVFSGVGGRVDFGRPPAAAINIDAAYGDTPLTVTGTAGKNRGAVTMNSGPLPLLDFVNGYPGTLPFTVAGGTADQFTVTVNWDAAGMKIAGEADLRDGAAVAAGWEVRDITGPVFFTDHSLYLFNEAKLAGQPVKVTGPVDFSGAEPVVELTVNLPAFDPAVLEPALGTAVPVTGPVAADFKLTGAWPDLLATGEVSLPQGQIDKYEVTDVRAKFALGGGRLTIAALTGEAAGGRVEAAGTVAWPDVSYNLHIRAADLESSRLAAAPGLSGPVSAEVVATGAGSLAQATVAGTAAMPAGSYDGLPFSGLALGFWAGAGQVKLTYLSAAVGGGTLTAAGSIRPEECDLTLRGREIPLSLLAQAAGPADLSGIADFSGRITGPLSGPEFTAEFTAVDGQAFSQPFARAGGHIYLTGDRLGLEKVAVENGPTRHLINGTVGLGGDHPLALTVATVQARAENLIDLLAPGEPLTGNVDNELMLTGSLTNPDFAGRVTLTEGSYRGYLIDRAETTYHRRGGLTVIDNLAVKAPNMRLNLAGTVDSAGRMDLTISGQEIDLARLKLKLPYPVTGLAAVSGRLTGQLADPEFTGGFQTTGLQVNGRAIDMAAGTLTWRAGQLTAPEIQVVQGTGKYSFSGGIDFTTNMVQGALAVENGEAAALIPLLNIPVTGVSGQLNGHIRVSGLLSRPDVTLTGALTNGVIKDYPLQNIDIDVELHNNIIQFNQFTARQGAGLLAVRGTADLDGPLKLEIGGRDLDAGLLTAWFDQNIATRGRLNFTAQVEGTAASPHTALSLAIADGAVNNATFDSLYGMLVFTKGDIQVDQLLLAKGPYRARAYGVIPTSALGWPGGSPAGEAGQMNLKVRLDEANLSILPFLTREVAWATGDTQGEITIGGTMAQPTISGRLAVRDGTIKLAALNDPIQKVGVDIEFIGDKIKVRTIEGQSGGGNLRLTGDMAVRGRGLADYNLALTADKFRVDSKYFKGPLNGTLRLTTVKDKPVLAGQVAFDDDTLAVPLEPQFTATDFDLGLDVEVTASKKVRLYSPYLYDIWGQGQVKISGTLADPAVEGRLVSQRGTINYLGTRFKIRAAKADFSPPGFEPSVRLVADTRFERATITLSVSGPLSELQYKLQSEPYMSQQEILTLLTLRDSYYSRDNNRFNIGADGVRDSGFGRDELMSLMSSGLQMRFVGEVENLFREAFGVDQFQLTRGSLESGTGKRETETATDREVYNLEFTKYLSDRLMLSYSLGVERNAYNFAVEYNINRRMILSGMVDWQHRQWIGLETRFRF